jgi:hypothetical protein
MNRLGMDWGKSSLIANADISPSNVKTLNP